MPHIRTLFLHNAFINLDLMTRLSANTTEGEFELVPNLNLVEGLSGLLGLDQGSLQGLKAAREWPPDVGATH